MAAQKYRQRGYMDSDRDGSRERDGAGPRERRGSAAPRQRDPGPRGRGLGKPTATVFRCAVCGREPDVDVVGYDAACGGCGADLHTCTHCAWFDTSAVGECRKDAKDYVAAKAKRNLCELFEAKATQEFAKEPDSPTSAKAAFDDLFK